MPDHAQNLLQTYLPDTHLGLFAQRLTEWLLNEANETVESFTESRAKALLRATNAIDDPTLNDFMQRMGQETAVRLALYTLLQETQLAEDESIKAIAATAATVPNPQSLVPSPQLLAIAAYAHQRGYPLAQLDPAYPPAEFSPAGQIVKRTGGWMRQQVLRTATERDKLARKLVYTGQGDGSATPTLDNMPDQPAAAAVPPHYRPPIPVTYPEVANETLQVGDGENSGVETAVSTNGPLKITEADIPQPPQPRQQPQQPQPVRMPRITITEEQVQTTSQRIQQRVVEPTVSGASAFATAVQKQWRNSRERMTTTKLRVVVQEYPDGPPLYGLQIRISCRGVRTSVAGTSNRNGVFMAELPVRVNSGLTYDVQVDWPRDYGGEKERKSITLNAERTQFELPFYLKHNP